MTESLNNNIKTPNDKVAMAFFRSLRWVNGVYCPQCKSYDIVNRGQQGRVRRYSCKECGSNFNDFTGTIFHKSRMPMGMMLYVLFNMDDKTITQLSEETGYSRQCISRLTHLFKEKLINNLEFYSDEDGV
ncbi:MAG: transposase [Methanobrevibacter sp.]